METYNENLDAGQTSLQAAVSTTQQKAEEIPEYIDDRVKEGVIVGGSKTVCDTWKPCKAVVRVGEKGWDLAKDKAGTAYEKVKGKFTKERKAGPAEPATPASVDSATNNKTLEKGVTSDYKTSQRQTGDGTVHRDHQPSQQALKERAEQRNNGPLSPAQEKRIEKNSKVVTVQDDIHRAGPTYGGKNTNELYRSDACDLAGAACRDADAMIENAKRLDPDSLERYTEAAEEIKSMTNQDYDDWIDIQLFDE